MASDPIPIVVSETRMDDETFLLHFESRHPDKLVGLNGEFVDTILQQPEIISAYRAFHDRLHHFGIVEEMHEHED